MSHHGTSARDVLLEERVVSPLFQFWGQRAGMLTLTAEGVTFTPESGDVLTIPLGEIDIVDEGPARPFPAPGTRTLRITYAENIVFAVHVADPQQWMNAINTLSPQDVLNVLPEPFQPRDPRSFRVIIVLMLLLVIITSVAVPLFLTWMQARENQPLEPAISTDTGTDF